MTLELKYATIVLICINWVVILGNHGRRCTGVQYVAHTGKNKMQTVPHITGYNRFYNVIICLAVADCEDAGKNRTQMQVSYDEW